VRSSLLTVSPNSYLLFPTSCSPDISSIVIYVGSRYIPLATSFYGSALNSVRGSPRSTVSRDVVVVARIGKRAPVAIQGGCIFGPFYVSLPAVFGSIPIFLLLPHIP